MNRFILCIFGLYGSVKLLRAAYRNGDRSSVKTDTGDLYVDGTLKMNRCIYQTVVVDLNINGVPLFFCAGIVDIFQGSTSIKR